MNIIIDSSVIIDYTRAGKGIFPKILSPKNEIYIPTIVISELWAGKSMNRKKDAELVEKMIGIFKRMELNEDSAKIAGNLLRKNVVFGFDAIIAASALYLDAELATMNNKHFAKVKGLKLFKLQKT
jgi:predicted nucleic acid-binding protein